MANGNFGGGDGTQGSPYLVEDMLDLRAIDNNLALHFKQTKNIELIDSFEPIGGSSGKFTGVYDGGSFLISGLSQYRMTYFGGLFSQLSYPGVLKNTHLIDVTIVGVQSWVGALVGAASSGTRVESCSSKGSVSGTRAVGGLIGDVVGATIENCFSSCKVIGTIEDIGGLVGSLNASLSNSYASGDVDGRSKTGGLVGFCYGSSSINNCYSSGTIISRGGNTGGLVGRIDGFNVNGCYALSPLVHKLEGTEQTIGAFCGYASMPEEIESRGNYYLDTMEFRNDVSMS